MRVLEHLLSDEGKTKELIKVLDEFGYKIVEDRCEAGFSVVPSSTRSIVRKPKKPLRRKRSVHKYL
jgi:hypothetical protein